MNLARRACLAAAGLLAAACAAGPDAAQPGTPAGPLQRLRTVTGGFLSRPPARAGSGMFVRFLAPTAVALQGHDLLVVDSGAGRVWRVDLGLGTLTAIAGAPALPNTAVALGADLSAWVLDASARQVLRFSADGRLMQTLRAGPVASTPSGFALVDGGATLLLADPVLGQWLELRAVGVLAAPVRPLLASGLPVGLDGIAAARDTVFLLDRRAGLVHRVRRDGTVLDALGGGELKQPVALAADRQGRVYVVDAQDRSIKLLQAGRPTQVFDAAQLGVQQIGGIAVDDVGLAVTDRAGGQVLVHAVRHEVLP